MLANNRLKRVLLLLSTRQARLTWALVNVAKVVGLGHADVATTLRYYVDVVPEDLEEAAETLSESDLVQFLGVIRTAHFCYCKGNTNL